MHVLRFLLCLAIHATTSFVGIHGYSTLVQPSTKSAIGGGKSEEAVSLRIRSARDDDLDHVATLLAEASTTNTSWMERIQQLKTRSAILAYLRSTQLALQEGRKASKTFRSLPSGMADTDRLRQMWTRHYRFRERLESAASLSTDPHHLWRGHNFAICPDCVSHLQHALIVAESKEDGAIVGFCEVAMLESPNSEEGDASAVPTIGNLVVCPDYRRRGIAGSLLRFSSRYVSEYWFNGETIALYVKRENKRASALYSKHGFVRSNLVESPIGDYMTRSLVASSMNRIPAYQAAWRAVHSN